MASPADDGKLGRGLPRLRVSLGRIAPGPTDNASPSMTMTITFFRMLYFAAGLYSANCEHIFRKLGFVSLASPDDDGKLPVFYTVSGVSYPPYRDLH